MIGSDSQSWGFILSDDVKVFIAGLYDIEIILDMYKAQPQQFVVFSFVSSLHGLSSKQYD